MEFLSFPQIANKCQDWNSVKEIMRILGWSPPYMNIYSILRQAVESGYLETRTTGWGTQLWRAV